MLKQFITICTVVILTLVSGAYASPKKESLAPAKEVPPAKSTAQGFSLSGKVVETMNAGGYTYVCIQKNGKKTWFAVPETPVRVGQEITFEPGQEMTGFFSKTLNRTFDSIIFSGGPALKTASMNQAKAADAKHGGSKAAAAKTDETIRVEKATGASAYTVGDIFAQRTKLNKKKTVVKAKVVKVSAGIMGKNWIHLQDGSGDASKGTNNLVVTSQDLPSVGDIITMEGTVYKDKDFGSGYKYTVIMEEASIQR